MTYPQRRIRIILTIAAFLLLQSQAIQANICTYKSLKPIRRFCGMVVDSSGEPILNATVSVLKGGTQVLTKSTDAKGLFEFDLTEPGEYEVHAGATNFGKMSFRFKLSRPNTKCKGVVVIQLGVAGDCSDVKFMSPKRV